MISRNFLAIDDIFPDRNQSPEHHHHAHQRQNRIKRPLRQTQRRCPGVLVLIHHHGHLPAEIDHDPRKKKHSQMRNQGQRFGAALLKDAILRTVSVSRSIGVRAILVHAITEDAKRFYANYGFKESPINKMTLMLSLQQIKTHF